MNKVQLLVGGGMLVGVILVLLLSWIPNPNVGDVLPVPASIRYWINANGNVRTAVPLGMLGFGVEWVLQSKNKGWRWRGWTWLGLVGIVAVAELGQMLLPSRHPDWSDIFYGALGAALGIVGAKAVALISKR
ncbi:MAG: VanZ family protein [Runella zeae]